MEHPGIIVFVDGLTSRIVREAKAEDVPDSVRFAPTALGPKPVVRVVCFDHPDVRIIREYGESGELLRERVSVHTDDDR